MTTGNFLEIYAKVVKKAKTDGLRFGWGHNTEVLDLSDFPTYMMFENMSIPLEENLSNLIGLRHDINAGFSPHIEEYKETRFFYGSSVGLLLQYKEPLASLYLLNIAIEANIVAIGDKEGKQNAI